MINLLPPDFVHELRAARTNTILRRYLLTSLMALVAVIMMFGAAFYINQQQYLVYEQQRQESQQELADVKDVEQQIADYNSTLKEAGTAYKAEIKLTNLVANLSSTLPQGAILNTVSLDVLSFTEPVTITAQVDTLEKAGVLKRNFEQSKFFSAVVLQQVAGSSEAEDGEESEYPFTAILEVELTPEAAAEGGRQGESGEVI